MTIYDRSQGGGGAPAGHLPSSQYRPKKVIDFAETPYLAADVLNLFDIPADMFVERVAVRVIKAEGAVATAGVGDGTTPTGFLTAVNLNAVATTISQLLLTEGVPNTITGYTGGKHYAAGDKLDMTLNHNVSNGKIEVTMFGLYLR
jgi:hypothetical protein